MWIITSSCGTGKKFFYTGIGKHGFPLFTLKREDAKMFRTKKEAKAEAGMNDKIEKI